MAETAQDPIVRRFGAFEINVRSGELRKHGLRLRLSGQPLQILALLLERPGDVVTREELHAKLWPSQAFGDFDHGLNNAVARIREVLDDSSTTPRYVETIPRRGYRFIAPVSNMPQPGVAAPVAPQIVGEPIATQAETPLLGEPPPGQKTATTRIVFFAALAISLAAVGAFALVHYAHLGARQGIRSVAVLPLRNLSGDPKQEYLADAMTEEVIGRLAGIRHLRVISRTSVMPLKQTTLSAPEIGRKLHVDALVEGSVIRQANRVRIHAQLIRADTDEHFWSETYDRDIGDVLTLQSEVAQAIAEKVRVTITGAERTRLVAARHVSPEVYESYLKGQFGTHNNQAELRESIPYFEDAIRKDPTFAPAYVGLAKTYLDLGTIFVGGSSAEMRPKVLSSAKKALELDPNLAEAHALVAEIYQKQWRWRDAESEYQRALELKPNGAAALLGYADWLACRGRTEEALNWARRARELDPLGDAGPHIGELLLYARRYDEAIRELRVVLAVRPDAAFIRWSLGRSLIARGRPAEAIPELERTAVLMHDSPGALGILAAAYAAAGRQAQAINILDALKQRPAKSYLPAGAMIIPNVMLHNYDEAFAWLERAYAEQSNILQYLKVEPLLDPVRGDPRYQDLLRRVGLE